jgi:hypothetical protein
MVRKLSRQGHKLKSPFITKGDFFMPFFGYLASLSDQYEGSDQYENLWGSKKTTSSGGFFVFIDAKINF